VTKKMMDETFDFNDYLKQSQMVKKMGSMAGVARMLPGMAGV
jgi:signal recognition particle subunit SRP54